MIGMDRRLVASSIAILLFSSAAIAPASAQEAVDDPKQPSVDNPHMHLWGTDDLSSCWTHFDSNDSSGSAEGGYGEKTFGDGQQVSVDYTCSMQENFLQDMYLNSNGTIEIDLVVNIWSGDCEPGSECKNLTLTLYQGNVQVAQKEFLAVDNNGNDEMISWDIPVDQNTTRWNKSNEEPRLQIEFSWPGYNGVDCLLFFVDCSGSFGMYYENNEDGNDAMVNFPVVNLTEGGPFPEGPEDGEDEEGVLPGFGLLTGLGALALASAASRSRIGEE